MSGNHDRVSADMGMTWLKFDFETVPEAAVEELRECEWDEGGHQRCL